VGFGFGLAVADGLADRVGLGVAETLGVGVADAGGVVALGVLASGAAAVSLPLGV
jgi:hypothetical protein